MNNIPIELAYLIKTESEKIVIGAIFANQELLKDSTLNPVNFGERKHQELFTALQEVDKKGMPIELVSVLEHLGMENAGRVGGLAYVAELIGSSFTTATASFEYHQKLILESYRRRKSIAIGEKFIQDAIDQNLEESVRGLNTSLLLLEENDAKEDLGHISEVLVESHDWMETTHGEMTGAPSGFRELDALTSGFQRQDLVIVGGRPSMGKTAFVINACANYATSKTKERPNGGVVALFSLEMKNRDLCLRMISNFARIDGQRMRNPQKEFIDVDWERSMSAIGQLGKMPMHMFDKPGINITFIRKKLRMLKRKYPGQHIVAMIDYLQLVRGDEKKNESRTQEISEISRALKQLAKELDLTVIALSQLSRKVEERQDKRPMLSDLRESGQIEQDADVIVFLYRDDYYHAESETQGLIEIIVAKQRNGPVGMATLAYIKEYSRFVNIERA